MYTQAITTRYTDHADLVRYADTNRPAWNAARPIFPPVTPTCRCTGPTSSPRMIRRTKPDVVLVTTPDVTHSDYIVKAMGAGCDVITEKPLTTDHAAAARFCKPGARQAGSSR